MLALVKESVRGYSTEASPKFSQIMTLDCRGLEPIEVQPFNVLLSSFPL